MPDLVGLATDAPSGGAAGPTPDDHRRDQHHVRIEHTSQCGFGVQINWSSLRSPAGSAQAIDMRSTVGPPTKAIRVGDPLPSVDAERRKATQSR
jgi:hypothetical protein